MKRIVLFILIVFCFWGEGYSKEVSIEQIKKVADVHSSMGYSQDIRVNKIAPDNYTTKEIIPLKSEDKTVIGYVAVFEPRGFTVISKDDSITPVIAYSFENNFSFKDSYKNVLLNLLKKDLTNRLEAIPLLSEEKKQKNKDKWESYTDDSGYYKVLASYDQWPTDDSGWLDTTWDQWKPYNKYCPRISPGSTRCVVGCMATAIAQIVNYNRFPESIHLKRSEYQYTTETYDGDENIVIDSSSTTHDFPTFEELNNMLSDIDYKDMDEDTIAALNFACGIVVEMDYGWNGPYISAVQYGSYRDVFTEDLGYVDSYFFSSSVGIDYDRLKQNMKTGRPALLGINDSGWGGHAIVADGYRSYGEYHLNFGAGSYIPDQIEYCWYFLPEGMPWGYDTIDEGIMDITSPTYNPYNQYSYAISYPNPFDLSETERVKITPPANSYGDIDRVRIYTPSGDMVKQISGGSMFVEWNGSNMSGKECAPGIYFYSIRTSENEVYRGKLTVVR